MGKTLFADRMAGFKLPINLAVLASGATNTTQEIASFVAPHDMKLAAAFIALIAALTGAATNHISFNVYNKGTAGTGTTLMATLAFSSTAVTTAAGAPKALTLSATAANMLLSEGEIVSIQALPVASGQVYPICYPSVHFTLQ